MAFLGERVGREEIELVTLLYGERIDDDIALRPLVTLHGVDADVGQFGHAQPLNFLAYHGYLVAVGHDDTHRLDGIKTVAVEAACAPEHIGHNARLVGVHLVGDVGAAAVGRGNEYQAVLRECLFERVARCGRVIQRALPLVGQGHGAQMLGEVELMVGELGYLRVHAALPREHAREVGTAVHLLDADEPFEERVAAVGEAHGVELRIGDGRQAGVLLHHGWQLLVVSDEDELVGMGQQSHDVGFKNLTGLIDDGQVEVLQAKEVAAAEHGRCGADDDLCVEYLALDLCQLAILLQGVVEQMVAVAPVAGVLVADAQEVDAVV